MNRLLYSVKKCTECGELKPLTEFHKDSRLKSGYRAKCKICRHRVEYKYQKKGREKKYNLTKKQLKTLHKEQKHRCLICGKKEYLVIDHSHKHTFVRGLLCNKCNLGLGHFLDSPRRLLNAIIYLIRREILEQHLLRQSKILKKSYRDFMKLTNYFLSL